MGDINLVRLEHLHHLGVYLHRRSLQLPAVDTQEHVGSGKGDAFVSIYERMVDRKAFHQSDPDPENLTVEK
jgi:hypothetical protein